MQIQKEFKMTFSNSWWQCLVALFVAYFARMVVVTFAFIVFYPMGVSPEDIVSFSNILMLAFVMWLARRLSYQTWKKKMGISEN